MTTLYWDCFSGIAGNMAVASLLDLGADIEKLTKAIASLNFEEGPVELIAEERMSMGIRGIYFNTLEDDVAHSHFDAHVDEHAHTHCHSQDHDAHAHAHSHEHTHCHDHNEDEAKGGHVHGHDHDHVHHHAPHRGMKEIRELILNADITDGAKNIALKCFQALAEAEAKIHGKPIDEVHFHEVGARDSIVDMVGAAVCLDDLKVSSVRFSPVHLGSGLINCAHGVIPVPAPATALLLKGLPVIMDASVPFELTTPTGAALLKGLEAAPMSAVDFTYEAVGHGLGSKKIGRPNFLRAFLSKSDECKKKNDVITLLETNLDNVTGELLGYVTEKLMEEGALDVCLVPVVMKKGRPGHILRVVASNQFADKLENIIFSELPTLGIRRQQVERSILAREEVQLATDKGELRGKKIVELNGSVRAVVEFDEMIRLATVQHEPLRNIKIDIDKTK